MNPMAIAIIWIGLSVVALGAWLVIIGIQEFLT